MTKDGTGRPERHRPDAPGVRGYLAATGASTAAMLLASIADSFDSFPRGGPQADQILMLPVAGALYASAVLLFGAVPVALFYRLARRIPIRNLVWHMLYGAIVGAVLGLVPAANIAFFRDESGMTSREVILRPEFIQFWLALFVLPGAAGGWGYWRATRPEQVPAPPSH